VAAWADIQAAVSGENSINASATVSTLNAGYAWMGMNVFCAAAFVLGMRRRINSMNFGDWDSKSLAHTRDRVTTNLCGSNVLQQPSDHPCSGGGDFPD
jgi:hypothetical protein